MILMIMGNPLARKLEQFVRLSPTERLRLDSLASKRQKIYRNGEMIFKERTKAEFVLLVVSGLAARWYRRRVATRLQAASRPHRDRRERPSRLTNPEEISTTARNGPKTAEGRP